MVARAAGTSVPVRADARLPYAAGASGWSEVGEAEAHPRATAPAGPELPAAPVARQAHPVTLQEEPVEPSAFVEATRAQLPAKPTGTAVERDALPGSPGVPDNSGTKMSTQLVSGELALIGEIRASALPMPLPLPLPLPPSMLPTASVPGEPQASVPVPPHEAATSARTAMHRDDPTPLMPHRAWQAPMLPVAQPSARRLASSPVASSTNGDDSTEVHIHIGRIDVTAVQEAPPPRRRTAAAPPPMSLEGYLAQRGRS